MTEQQFVYVDVDYLKELEETAKKVDYYKGIIDGLNMVIDRKTENSSEIPNNCEDCKWWFGYCHLEECEYEPKDESRLTAKCLNCANGGSYKCNKCDGEMYFKDDPQTYIAENRDTQVLDAWQVHHRNTTSVVEDDPQTDCAWKQAYQDAGQ